MTTIETPTATISEIAKSALGAAETRRLRVVAKAGARRIARGDAEAHRLRGLARLKVATAGAPTKVLRLEITNVLSGNDYSVQLAIGSKRALANVILDTGSSTLAVDPSIYNGVHDKDLKTTGWMQLITYGTGGWAGPVVDTTLSLGGGHDAVAMPRCPIAITTVQQPGNFQGVTGIMGLAYNGLNNAYDFSAYLGGQGTQSTYPWPFDSVWHRFVAGFRKLLQLAGATGVEIKPYFDQLEEGGVVANKFAFYTLRSWISLRRGNTVDAVSADPLNKGLFILGGGEEQQDLYSGGFVDVKVLHDLYYNTNLKSVRVDGCPAHPAAPLQPQYLGSSISNSIVDSGTSDLSLAQDVYDAIRQGLAQLNPAFGEAITAAAGSSDGVAAGALNLDQWPTIYFTLEGVGGEDIELACAPQTYWQVDFPAAGRAVFQIDGPLDQANQSILGLPLMNNYYTVFDRTQNINGVIRFAAVRAPV